MIRLHYLFQIPATFFYCKMKLAISYALSCFLKFYKTHYALSTWLSLFFFFILFQWGQNLTLLQDRVLRYPDRVRNLYFTFLFVLRAVTKVNQEVCFHFEEPLSQCSVIKPSKLTITYLWRFNVDFRRQIIWNKHHMIQAILTRI